METFSFDKELRRGMSFLHRRHKDLLYVKPRQSYVMSTVIKAIIRMVKSRHKRMNR